VDFREKKRLVFGLYERYERLVQSFKAQAVCKIGCASCCKDVGHIGATTLEGLIIFEYLQGWTRQAIEEITHRLSKNRSEKFNSVLVQCPFLDTELSCSIYDVRPFGCRRLYSVKKCDGQGAVVHRQALVLGRKAERELQELDPGGCSGHLSFILHLLNKERFRRRYLQGSLKTEDFKDSIERYQLVVHR